MKPSLMNQQCQSGATLIEVLVAILILSFGMLSLGAMMSFVVQLPKLSGYRATAANLASSYVERIRANPDGFNGDQYSASLNGASWSFTDIPLSDCAYPACTTGAAGHTLADMDIAATRRAVRRELPAGDMEMWCSDPTAPTTAIPCTNTSTTNTTQGNLWIIWQEPSTNSLLGASSDDCPPDVTSTYTGYPTLLTPARCLYVRFKIE